tara:strand:+ start:1464 stop:1817 length:354 start_codon:yes stop_codon:yes gene_type:complete
MPNYSSSVGLSKAGGDFAVGYRGAKKLRKDMAGKTIRLEREYYDKKKKKKKKKKSNTFKQKLLKALKISAKGAGGAAAIATELALPTQTGMSELPKGFHKMSPRKKAQYINSMKRSK